MVTWETVALAVGVAAFGALAGLAGSLLTYRGTKLNVAHEESEAWRKLLIEACQAFSDAWLELFWFLDPRASELDAKARKDLEPIGKRCGQTAARVILVFGRESWAGQAATDVDRKVEALKKAAVHAKIWNEDEIKSALKAAEQAHHEFQRRAQAVLEPTSWQPGSTQVALVETPPTLPPLPPLPPLPTLPPLPPRNKTSDR